MASVQNTTDPGNPLGENMNDFFLLSFGMVVFLMQCGFAFLEAGAVRSKNTTNILLKNLFDAFVAGLSYWAVGYAFAFGKGNGAIGAEYFFGVMPDSELSKWYFQFVFAATAATIVSGGVAERCEFVAYLIYSIFLTAFAYPVVTHWAWSADGWLTADAGAIFTDVGYQDFAGSGVIHLFGGLAALSGAFFLGPRIGRFDENGKPVKIRGHSVPLASLGAFILFFGFFAFNGGSQGQISEAGDGDAVARAIVNTIVSGSAAATTAMVTQKLIDQIKGSIHGLEGCSNSWSLLTTINGALTGMVAICAGCNVVESYGAFFIGLVAGLIYILVNFIVVKVKVDDPLDAVAVHAGGGLWGVIAAPLFDRNMGAFYGGGSVAGKTLLVNLIGALVIGLWSLVLMSTLFFTLKKLGLLRVSEEIEIKGLDIPKHNEPAYPPESYEDGWDEKITIPGTPVSMQKFRKLHQGSNGNNGNGNTGNGNNLTLEVPTITKTAATDIDEDSI